jgi:hypothetical protein
MRFRLRNNRAPRNQAGARRETLGRIGFRAVREGGVWACGGGMEK